MDGIRRKAAEWGRRSPNNAPPARCGATRRPRRNVEPQKKAQPWLESQFREVTLRLAAPASSGSSCPCAPYRRGRLRRERCALPVSLGSDCPGGPCRCPALGRETASLALIAPFGPPVGCGPP